MTFYEFIKLETVKFMNDHFNINRPFQIFLQILKVSFGKKTHDKSDRLSLALIEFIDLTAFWVPPKYSALSTTIELSFKL
jgi:hypothetical protein